MQEKHVILRATGPVSFGGGGFLGATPTADVAAQIDELKVDVDTLDTARAAAVASHSDVVAVAPVMPMRLIEPFDEPAAAPAASGNDWGIDAVGASTSPFTGDGIVVAVLDTGIDKNHPAFSGVTLVPRNFTDDPDEGDTNGHGTHCAGTIFGRDVSGVRIGVARGVRKAIIGKVLGQGGGGSDQIIQAIQWAVNEGANVVSMSLGIDFPGFQARLQNAGLPPELATSRALEGYRLNVILFEKLAGLIKAMGGFGHAAVLVAAAGNESRRNINSNFEIGVAPPAVADGIVSVAALGRADDKFRVADFSNTGAKISGPGVSITSAKAGGGLRVLSGTSMATPHVAGVAALWAQKMKALGPLSSDLLTNKLIGSGDVSKLQKPFDVTDVGCGMVQAPQN